MVPLSFLPYFLFIFTPIQGRPGSHRHVPLIEFCVIREQSKHTVLKGEHAREWEAAQAGGVVTGTQLLLSRKEKTVPRMGVS